MTAIDYRTPEVAYIEQERRNAILAVLKTLTAREQHVIRMRFGLDDEHEHTLKEVGQSFAVTQERIRQIEAKALRRLRHPKRCRSLKQYWFPQEKLVTRVSAPYIEPTKLSKRYASCIKSQENIEQERKESEEWSRQYAEQRAKEIEIREQEKKAHLESQRIAEERARFIAWQKLYLHRRENGIFNIPEGLGKSDNEIREFFSTIITPGMNDNKYNARYYSPWSLWYVSTPLRDIYFFFNQIAAYKYVSSPNTYSMKTVPMRAFYINAENSFSNIYSSIAHENYACQ